MSKDAHIILFMDNENFDCPYLFMVNTAEEAKQVVSYVAERLSDKLVYHNTIQLLPDTTESTIEVINNLFDLEEE